MIPTYFDTPSIDLHFESSKIERILTSYIAKSFFNSSCVIYEKGVSELVHKNKLLFKIQISAYTKVRL